MTEKQIITKIEHELSRLHNIGNFMRCSIRKTYLKCGKPECKCKKPECKCKKPNEKGHGPYNYINISKLNKKNISILIPDELQKKTKELLKSYISLKKCIERITLLNVKRFAAIKSKQKNSRRRQISDKKN